MAQRASGLAPRNALPSLALAIRLWLSQACSGLALDWHDVLLARPTVARPATLA